MLCACASRRAAAALLSHYILQQFTVYCCYLLLQCLHCIVCCNDFVIATYTATVFTRNIILMGSMELEKKVEALRYNLFRNVYHQVIKDKILYILTHTYLQSKYIIGLTQICKKMQTIPIPFEAQRGHTKITRITSKVSERERRDQHFIGSKHRL